MDLIHIENALREIPETIGKVGNEMKELMKTYKTIEAEFERDEAREKLKLQVKYSQEKGNKEDTRDRIKYEVVELMFEKKLQVIKAEADWKAKDVEYWVLDKKHKSITVSAGLFQSEQYQVGRLEKATKPMLNNQISKMGRE